MSTAIPGPPRDLIGYGEHPPRVRWHNDAKVAVQIVVNYEEGSEKTFAMGDGSTTACTSCRLPSTINATSPSSQCTNTARAQGSGGCFAYSTLPTFPVTFFAAAVALERNPDVAAKLARRGDEAAGHGYRWSNHYEMTRDEEREAISRAIASIEKTTGSRPIGLVLPRNERQHTRTRRRGGRILLRL